MFKVVREDKQVGRTYKTLQAAENAVQRQFGKSINDVGPGRVDIVAEDGNIIRVFYVA